METLCEPLRAVDMTGMGKTVTVETTAWPKKHWAKEADWTKTTKTEQL